MSDTAPAAFEEEWDWDNPPVAPPGTGYIKFSAVGDAVTGIVQRVVKGSAFDGSECPQLYLDTDEGEAIVTASQRRLHTAVAEARLRKGDRVTITFTGETPTTAGKHPMKEFTVTVERAGTPEPAPQLTPEQAAAATALAREHLT